MRLAVLTLFYIGDLGDWWDYSKDGCEEKATEPPCHGSEDVPNAAERCLQKRLRLKRLRKTKNVVHTLGHNRRHKSEDNLFGISGHMQVCANHQSVTTCKISLIWKHSGHILDTYSIPELGWIDAFLVHAAVACCCGYRLSSLKWWKIRERWLASICRCRAALALRPLPGAGLRLSAIEGGEWVQWRFNVSNASNSRISFDRSFQIDAWSVDRQKIDSTFDITHMKLYHFVCCKFGSRDMPSGVSVSPAPAAA